MTPSGTAYDLVILTDSRWTSIDSNAYHKNVLKEDFLLQEAFEKVGLKVIRKAWDDDFDWTSTRFAIFRSTWDYFDRLPEFRAWFEKNRRRTTFINEALLVEWNLHKSYLLDLHKKGIDIVPTKLYGKDDINDLTIFLNELPWKQIVVKPAASAGAFLTYRMDASNLESNNWFRDYLQERDLLIQPFLPEISSKGEVSMIYIGDKFSHAVLKKAKKGDYRVQDDHGGTVHDYSPNQEEIDFGLKALKACPILPLYSRIDFSWGSDAKPLLMEIELIEPELWFRKVPEAASKLADQFVKRYFQ